MNVSVLVPYRPDGAERDQAWTYLRPKWEALGWDVITGQCPPGPWNKALAVRDALTRATGDVLVIADADVSCPAAPAAVGAIAYGAPWAIPHTSVHRLDQTATLHVLQGGPLTSNTRTRPYNGMVGGGVTVLSRDVYEACPLDPRFTGWGQEDHAWGIALTALYGVPWRSPEPLWHLWHTPAPRLTQATGSAEGDALRNHYLVAAQTGRMADLIAEARQ